MRARAGTRNAGAAFPYQRMIGSKHRVSRHVVHAPAKAEVEQQRSGVVVAFDQSLVPSEGVYEPHVRCAAASKEQRWAGAAVGATVGAAVGAAVISRHLELERRV